MRRGLSLLAVALAGCTSINLPPVPKAAAGVAFDRNGEVGAFADGIADPQSGRAVTPDDPARVASVSKLVVAIGVMKLVEAGKLDLDSDVSRWLGWNLRNPAFPDRPITLRQLLSHTSSVRDHDDQHAIALGGSVQAEMANPTSWDLKHGPGDSYFTYSNMNFPIVGSIVERVTGERFDIWMRSNVLHPMKIDACYNWPTCSDEAVARAVELDTPDGKPVKDDLHGKRSGCPVYVDEGASCDLALWKLGENGSLFAPQGGLRISVRGLERVGRMLLNGGTLDGVRIISDRSVNGVFQPVWRFDGSNGSTEDGFYCTYGIATQTIPTPVKGCEDDPVGDGIIRQGHAGDAYGLRSGLWLDRARGVGVAFFVTGLGTIRRATKRLQGRRGEGISPFPLAFSALGTASTQLRCRGEITREREHEETGPACAFSRRIGLRDDTSNTHLPRRVGNRCVGSLPATAAAATAAARDDDVP